MENYRRHAPNIHTEAIQCVHAGIRCYLHYNRDHFGNSILAIKACFESFALGTAIQEPEIDLHVITHPAANRYEEDFGS